LIFWGITLRVAMLHGSLSLGPTLRSGLPPVGRHHFAALMQKKGYDHMDFIYSMCPISFYFDCQMNMVITILIIPDHYNSLSCILDFHSNKILTLLRDNGRV